MTPPTPERRKKPKVRSKSRRPELISRLIRVEGVSFSVYRSLPDRRRAPFGPPVSVHLEIRGELDEPVATTSRILLSVAREAPETGEASLLSGVGQILQIRPEIVACVGLESAAFELVWNLASAGLLRHGHLAFTPPHRGSARILGVSFTSEEEE